eukprot:919803-Pleurochrysis_carterae.AAC.1
MFSPTPASPLLPPPPCSHPPLPLLSFRGRAHPLTVSPPSFAQCVSSVDGIGVSLRLRLCVQDPYIESGTSMATDSKRGQLTPYHLADTQANQKKNRPRSTYSTVENPVQPLRSLARFHCKPATVRLVCPL